MSERIPHLYPDHVDPSRLADTIWLNRDELRDIPGRIGRALSLARTMVTEMDMDRPEWITHDTIDALLGCAETAAKHLGRRLTDLLGADDLDAKCIELRILYEEADAVRKATPRGTAPEQHARNLILKAVKDGA